jgi:predicted transposase/invertase (TIGR01784 family)
VVETQVLNVEAVERRVVYNVAKAYTNQLDVGEAYPDLDDIIGVTICDFELWPHRELPHVPMLSRWRMQEQMSGVPGLPELQFVFLELPKYDAAREPETRVEKWAYFFREAKNLTVIPPSIEHPPLLEALEAARTAHFTKEEWDAYIAAGMAIQDEREALSQARKEGLRLGIEALCEALGIELTAERRAHLDALDAAGHDALLARLRAERRWAGD